MTITLQQHELCHPPFTLKPQGKCSRVPEKAGQLLTNPRMKLHLIGALSLIAVATLAAADSNNNNGKVSSSETSFMKNAAQGGMAEVELGQLAQQKASSSDVKDFGRRMVTDHSKAGDQLKALAAKKGVTLPEAVAGKDKSTSDKLSKLSGADFDKAYMNDMINDHETDVAEFQKAANNASDQDVRAFASSTLPTLQEHLKMAKETGAKVGATAK
jgi:putative membrane protein